MALASLILGILSILISLGHPIFNIFGVVAGLTGIVLGYFARRRSEKRQGIAPVSYTHLDVYKRQPPPSRPRFPPRPTPEPRWSQPR